MSGVEIVAKIRTSSSASYSVWLNSFPLALSLLFLASLEYYRRAKTWPFQK